MITKKSLRLHSFVIAHVFKNVFENIKTTAGSGKSVIMRGGNTVKRHAVLTLCEK